MAAFDVKTLQKKVTIGSDILLMLRTGREMQGRLVEIGEHHVTIRNSNGDITVLIEMLAGWETLEILHEDTRSPSSLQPPILDKQPSLNLPVEVVAKVVEIETRFRAELRKPSLHVLPPDFRLPKVQLSFQIEKRIRQELDNLKNKWDYAHKINELSRLEPATRKLEQLAHEYSDTPIFSFNLGCYYLELNRPNEAIRAFRQAAQTGKNIDAFLNLAATALKVNKRGVACYALQQFFLREVPVNQPGIWQLCVGLSAEFQAFASLGEIMQHHAKMPNEALPVLLIETLIYLLKTAHLDSDAHALAIYLLPNAPVMPSLQELSDAAITRLPSLINTEYDQEIQSFLGEAARIIKEQQKAKQLETFMEEARSWAQRGNLAQAIGKVRKVYEQDPNNAEARTLEADWQEKLKGSQKSQIGLPRQRGVYQEAKRADLIEKNLKKAERLYRAAIKEGDSWESAIKDLAALLSRQNRDGEAIELLTQYLNRVENKRALLHVLVHLYQRTGQYNDAINCLRDLLAGAAQDEQLRILKQVAFCQFKARHYDEAEKTLQIFLKRQPNDLTAQRWLEQLRLARETGGQSDLDAWFKTKELLTEFETSLSDFLTFHLERCQYEGAKAERVAARVLSQEDVEELNFLAEKMGTARPRERSQLHLSAAKILMDLGETREFRIRRSLRNFCAAMGDACVAEGRHLDVVRTYYREAFLIAPEWVDQLEIKLAQYIMSFYATAESLLRPNPSIQDCLASVFAFGDLGIKVVHELLHLSVIDVDVATFLLPKVYQSNDLRQKITNACCILLALSHESAPIIDSLDALMRLWEQGRQQTKRQQQELVDQLQAFQLVAPTWDALEDQIQRLNDIKDKLREDLDRQRAEKIREILQFIIDYTRQTDYREKETLATRIQNRSNDLMKEIEAGPTKFSLELFYPYLRSLQSFIDSDFQQFRAAAEPEISVALAVEEYIPDDRSVVGCQINFSNRPGKSPASAVSIIIQRSPEQEYLFTQK